MLLFQMLNLSRDESSPDGTAVFSQAARNSSICDRRIHPYSQRGPGGECPSRSTITLSQLKSSQMMWQIAVTFFRSVPAQRMHRKFFPLWVPVKMMQASLGMADSPRLVWKAMWGFRWSGMGSNGRNKVLQRAIITEHEDGEGKRGWFQNTHILY